MRVGAELRGVGGAKRSEEGCRHEALGNPVVAEPSAAVTHWILLLDDPKQVARRDPDLKLVGRHEVVGGLVELRGCVTTSQESSLPGGLRRLGGWRETQSMSNGETLKRELAS